MMPGTVNGSVTVRNALTGLRAQVRRRLQQRAVQLLHVRVERQDHERQVGVDDPEIDREVRVEHADGLVDESDRDQQVVDGALVGQQAHPGVDAQQERSPERQDDRHQQKIARHRRGSDDAVGDGIADEQADDGGDRRDLDRVDVGAGVKLVLEDVDEVVEHEPDGDDALLRSTPASRENGGLAMIDSARLIFATMKNGNRKKISIHT